MDFHKNVFGKAPCRARKFRWSSEAEVSTEREAAAGVAAGVEEAQADGRWKEEKDESS